MLQEFEEVQKMVEMINGQPKKEENVSIEVSDNDTLVVSENGDIEVVTPSDTTVWVVVDNTELPSTEEAQAVVDQINATIDEEMKEVEDWLTLWEFMYSKEAEKAKEEAQAELDKEEETITLPEVQLADIEKEEVIKELTDEVASTMNSSISTDKKIESIVAMFAEEKEELLLEKKLEQKKNELLEREINKLNEELVTMKYDSKKVSIDDDNLWRLVANYKEYKADSKNVSNAEKLGVSLTKHLTTIFPEVTRNDISDIITKKREAKINQMTWLSEGSDSTLGTTTITRTQRKTLSPAEYGYMLPN